MADTCTCGCQDQDQPGTRYYETSLGWCTAGPNGTTTYQDCE